mgnify:CR=1 FL=1
MKIGNLREEKPRRTELPNGLRIITERLRHVRSVSTGIWTATGARWEAPGETGIAHFLEHMLFKGTLNRSVAEIARTMDALGGNLDAYTSKELVSYNVKVLAPHLPTAMDVLSDMVRNPLLAEEDIEKEKGVILEELKMEQDNPESFANDLFQELFWPDHTLGTPILGTPETVAEFSPTIVRRYFQDYYVPANMVVTAAGNIEHDAFVELVASRVRPGSWSNA